MHFVVRLTGVSFFVALFFNPFLACNKSSSSSTTTSDTTVTSGSTLADQALIEKVQSTTFQYFWDFAHSNSGMARERSSSGDVVTTGGTGFGISAIVVATSRGWITRSDAVERLQKITSFLATADRFHGAWSHWINGATGKVEPFSTMDDGGDLVETAYLMNGLLIAQAYYTGSDAAETALRSTIQTLWEGVEWDWYASRGDGKLYWHWSPDYDWQMNQPVTGWDEALITYVLALASPTHPITAAVYNSTWVDATFGTAHTSQGYTVTLGTNYIGPLFFAHYSFIGLDPRQMQDSYTNYWMQNVKHTLINRSYCIYSAGSSYGYSASLWGLTASDGPDGYSSFAPSNDNGTVAPTAALSSMPYTPYYSMQVMRNLYNNYSRLWGTYGFYDALNVSRSWYDSEYLSIDQGPIVCMIENYRSGLLWNLFMGLSMVKTALQQINIANPSYATGFYLAVPEAETKVVDLMKHPDKSAYLADVAIQASGAYTLTVEKSDGTVAETIWDNVTKASGTYAVPFGTSIATGSYSLRLKSDAVNIVLPVVLH